MGCIGYDTKLQNEIATKGPPYDAQMKIDNDKKRAERKEERTAEATKSVNSGSGTKGTGKIEAKRGQPATPTSRRGRPPHISSDEEESNDEDTYIRRPTRSGRIPKATQKVILSR